MATNFKESAKRHLSDAEYLHNSGNPLRKGNANQLFGVAGECALKAVMVALGLPTKPSGDLQDFHQYGHFPKLWNEAVIFMSGSLGGKYAAVIQPATGAPAPFTSWKVAHRYESNSWITASSSDFATHQGDSLNCLALLELAEEDGIL